MCDVTFCFSSEGGLELVNDCSLQAQMYFVCCN